MCASSSRLVEHPEWGPSFPEYINTFQLRLQYSFARYVGQEEIIINASRDLIPLPLLETTLAVGENMHVVGFQTGDQIFPTLINTIKKYTEIYQGRIFDHYYGFLCIRHLIRMVCIGTLSKSGLFGRVLNELDPTLPWVHLLGVLSDATLLFMKGHFEQSDKDGHNSTFLHGPLFLDETALDLGGAKLLLNLLWNDRDRIIPLRAHDVLPGLPALIVLLSQLIGHNHFHAINPDWVCIQDVSIRCFLGCLEDSEETDEERYILERTNIFILNLFNKQNVTIMETYGAWVAVDDNDARTVVEMYSKLSRPGYLESPVMFNYVILRWVFGLLSNPSTRRPGLDELASSVFKTALALLQTEIDRELESHMSDTIRGLMILATHDAIEQIMHVGHLHGEKKD